jgi:hypothetical protein
MTVAHEHVWTVLSTADGYECVCGDRMIGDEIPRDLLDKIRLEHGYVPYEAGMPTCNIPMAILTSRGGDA